MCTLTTMSYRCRYARPHRPTTWSVPRHAPSPRPPSPRTPPALRHARPRVSWQGGAGCMRQVPGASDYQGVRDRIRTACKARKAKSEVQGIAAHGVSIA